MAIIEIQTTEVRDLVPEAILTSGKTGMAVLSIQAESKEVQEQPRATIVDCRVYIPEL
jgi:hypothetical protein